MKKVKKIPRHEASAVPSRAGNHNANKPPLNRWGAMVAVVHSFNDKDRPFMALTAVGIIIGLPGASLLMSIVAVLR